jgi:hypothetical protein
MGTSRKQLPAVQRKKVEYVSLGRQKSASENSLGSPTGDQPPSGTAEHVKEPFVLPRWSVNDPVPHMQPAAEAVPRLNVWLVLGQERQDAGGSLAAR